VSRSQSLWLGVGAFLLTACGATGPVPLAELRPGEPLRTFYRVAPPDSVLSVRLIRQVNGSIEVNAAHSPTPIRIRLTDLDALRVIRGRARPKGTAAGAIGGGIVGILAGMTCRTACSETTGGERYTAPLTGLLIGASLGAVVGAIIAPPRWLDVRFR
jgi:hypothetical protein